MKLATACERCKYYIRAQFDKSNLILIDDSSFAPRCFSEWGCIVKRKSNIKAHKHKIKNGRRPLYN